MNIMFLGFLFLFSFGCHASDRKMEGVSFGQERSIYLKKEYLGFVHGFNFNSEVAHQYLKYLAEFKDLPTTTSPFTQEDELLLDHLVDLKKKESFWLGYRKSGWERYATHGCAATLCCALTGVCGSLYAPTLPLQAFFGIVGEGSATYLGYYATGLFPREVTAADAAVQYMKQQYINNFTYLAAYLSDFFVPTISRQDFQIINLAEGIIASLPALQKRFLEKTGDYVFITTLLIPLSRACSKILGKNISPNISSPGTPPPKDFAEGSALVEYPSQKIMK